MCVMEMYTFLLMKQVFLYYKKVLHFSMKTFSHFSHPASKRGWGVPLSMAFSYKR